MTLSLASAIGVSLLVAKRVETQPSRSAAPLTIEQLIDIRHPSSPLWSPDGRHVVFVWDRAGVSKVYAADMSDAPAPPRELRDAGSSLAGAFWSSDGRALMITKNGDLWRVPIDGSAASAVWTTPAIESGVVPSPDGSRVAFVRSAAGSTPAATGGGRGGRGRGAGVAGELIVRALADGHETVVLRSLDHAIGGVSWSPDGQTLVFNDVIPPIRHEQTPEYSGSKIIYTITENLTGESHAVAAAGGNPTLLGTLGGFGGRRWIDARHLVVDRTSADFKRRTTSLVDVGGGAPTVLHEDVKEKF